jgi:hypothetical protein
LTWVRCECGCGWEGEDEVTQYLIEEAVLMRPRVDETNRVREWEREREPELELDKDAAELLARHAELSALRTEVSS